MKLSAVLNASLILGVFYTVDKSPDYTALSKFKEFWIVEANDFLLFLSPKKFLDIFYVYIDDILVKFTVRSFAEVVET